MTENTTASGAADDSLLLCASDLQHSAIYDNPHEMVNCVRAVADRITALAASAPVAPSPQPAAPQWDWDMLRAHAEGRVTHINNGLCPDIIEGHDTRDPECPVCQALLENHTALPAPPQGATKEQK